MNILQDSNNRISNFNFLIVFVWPLIGLLNQFILLALVLLQILLWVKNNNFVFIVIGFFYLTLLSDSRIESLEFSQSFKVYYILIVFIVYFLNRQTVTQSIDIHKFLIPYLLFGLLCLVYSPIVLVSFQKTLSYLLVFLLIPNLILFSYQKFGVKTFRLLSITGSIILFLGASSLVIPIPFIAPFLSDRFSGMFGNPNGLGNFSMLFLIFFSFTLSYFPDQFSKREKIITIGLIIFSIILSGSRTAFFSAVLFLIFFYPLKKYGFFGFLSILIVGLASEIFIDYLINIIVSLNLGDFFRIETLQTGSGRTIAFDYAWRNIQESYWIGKGIGYGDHLFKINYNILAAAGHQGGVHNTYLNVWLDVGLIGLILFILGFVLLFKKLLKVDSRIWALLIPLIFSTFTEAWLVASLSPWTFIFICSLTLIYIKGYIIDTNQV